MSHAQRLREIATMLRGMEGNADEAIQCDQAAAFIEEYERNAANSVVISLNAWMDVHNLLMTALDEAATSPVDVVRQTGEDILSRVREVWGTLNAINVAEDIEDKVNMRLAAGVLRIDEEMLGKALNQWNRDVLDAAFLAEESVRNSTGARVSVQAPNQVDLASLQHYLWRRLAKEAFYPHEPPLPIKEKIRD